MPDQTLPSDTIDTSDPPVLEDTGGTKDETGPSGKAPRKSLPRRSKKRTTYKEPSDDDFEEDERVPAASKKARLDRDRDQAAPNHSQPTAYLANTGPRDPHADAYGRGPLPRMHLPDERNLDPRLPGHAHSQMAPMPAYGAYGSPYDRRPSSFPPEHPYMNGTPPVDAHSPYMFDRPPAHSSPYDHPVGGHHPGHPVPGYFQPPPAQYHPPPAPYYTPPPPQSSYPSPQDSYMYHNYGPSSYAPDGRGPQFLGSHRAASSPRPIDATPGTGMMHPGPPLEDPEVLANAQWTSDANAKISPAIRRRCYNCHETQTATWRRSTVYPGKVLCNKCGLFERTHHKPRPLTLGERDPGRTRTPRTNTGPTPIPAPHQATQPGTYSPIPVGTPPVHGQAPAPQDPYISQHPTPENGRMTPQANGQRPSPPIKEHNPNIDPRMGSFRPEDPAQRIAPQDTPSNIDPRLTEKPAPSGIPSLSEMMAQNRERENAASRGPSASNSGRASPVTLPPISVLDSN